MKWYMSLFRDESFPDLSRQYNALFAYTSIGTNEQQLPPGPPAYKIRGELIHNIGEFEPPGSQPQTYAQIYVLDSDKLQDLRSNMAASFHFDDGQMEKAKRIQSIMTRHNSFAKSYVSMRNH
ncbi:hypothetical protein AC1031_013008 [Aphanomyces cochlioides]|nr:hypothetical protein AC1031_013008 [Aphanomyces cochlioides]